MRVLLSMILQSRRRQVFVILANNPSTSTRSLFENTKRTHISVAFSHHKHPTNQGRKQEIFLAAVHPVYTNRFFPVPDQTLQTRLVSYDFFVPNIFLPGLRYARYAGIPYCIALTMTFESYCVLPGRPDNQRGSPGINLICKVAPSCVFTGPLQSRSWQTCFHFYLFHSKILVIINHQNKLGFDLFDALQVDHHRKGTSLRASRVIALFSRFLIEQYVEQYVKTRQWCGRRIWHMSTLARRGFDVWTSVRRRWRKCSWRPLFLRVVMTVSKCEFTSDEALLAVSTLNDMICVYATDDWELVAEYPVRPAIAVLPNMSMRQKLYLIFWDIGSLI